MSLFRTVSVTLTCSARCLGERGGRDGASTFTDLEPKGLSLPNLNTFYASVCTGNCPLVSQV